MKESYIQLDLTKPAGLKASAGTGKTYSLIRLTILYLLQKENPPTLNQILLVTFTNKATAELKQRLRELFKALIDQDDNTFFNEFIEEHSEFFKNQHYDLSSDLPYIQEQLLNAYELLDEVPIFTIHSFCQHLLRAYPFESKQNFNFTLIQNEEILTEVIRDFFRQYEKKMPARIEVAFLSYVRSYPALRTNDIQEMLFSKESLVDVLKKDLDLEAIEPSQELQDYYWYLYEEFSRGSLDINNTVKQLQQTPYDATNHHLWQAFQSNPQINTNLFVLLNTLAKYLPKICVKTLDTIKAAPTTKTYSDWLVYLLSQLAQYKLLDTTHLESSTKSHNRGFNAFFKAMKAYLVTQIYHFTLSRHKRQRQQQSVMRFDDFISDLYYLLADEQLAKPFVHAVRNNFRVALIDEFQDTDHKQWHIFYTLFKPYPHESLYHTYLLIGDPKQSIYRFRGANLAVYNRAMHTIDPDNIANLKHNFRSNAPLISAINTLFVPLFDDATQEAYEPIEAKKADALLLRKNQQILDHALTFLSTDEDILLTSAPTLNDYANNLCIYTILDLLKPESPYDLWNPKTEVARKVLPSDIACLTKKNKDADILKNLLKQYNLSAINITTISIFDTKEFAFVKLFLQALLTKNNQDAPIKHLYHHSYLEPFRTSHEGDYHHFIEKFSYIQYQLHAEGVIYALEKCLHIFKITTNQLHNITSGERFFVNMRHIQDILLQLAKECSLLDAQEILNALNNLIDRNDDDSSENDNSLRLEHDNDAIQILTAHKSKGLEYPIVFSFTGLVPQVTMSQINHLAFMTPEGGYAYQFNPQKVDKEREMAIDLAEIKRLFYVSCTRAQSHLFLPLLPAAKKTPLGEFLMQILAKYNYKPQKDTKSFPFFVEHLSTLSKSIQVLRYSRDDWTNISSLTAQDPSKSHHLCAHTAHFDSYARITPIQSYSSLSRNKSHYVPLDPREEVHQEPEVSLQETPNTATPLTIRGGATLGSLLHKLFEDVDFAQANCSLKDFLENKEIHQDFQIIALNFFNIEWIEVHLNVVKELFWQTLNQTLAPNIPHPLAQLFLANKKRSELSFFIHLQKDVTFSLAGEEYHLQAGFLTGFIDLVFEFENKFYILDWKSSHLGAHIDDYNHDRMQEEMVSQHFIVQYYLYMFATMHYARFFNPHFSYDDIGGAYYLFCRGINLSNHNGIYFDKPSLEDFTLFSNAFKEAIITFS